MDADPTLLDLASGLIREEQLAWQDYQRLVAHVIKRQNLTLLASSEVVISENEHSGEIDVIIRYMSPDIRIGTDNTARWESIFVECKRRSRKLELDDIGKVFCYSILHQPRALYIVSPFPLAPQAITCARQLFAFEGASAGLFKQTAIYHRTLRQLITPAAPVASSGGTAFSIETWSIAIEDVFRNELVGDDSFCPSTIEVPVGASIVFALTISCQGQHSLAIRLRCGAVLVGEEHVSAVARTESVEIRFTLGEQPITLDGLELESDALTALVRHQLRPIEFLPGSPSSAFGDLRAREAVEFAEGLAHLSAPLVSAIVGEAGVGKTFFCEAAALHLSRRHNFNTFRATVNPNDDYYVFLVLIRHFFIPLSDQRVGRGAEARDDLSFVPEAELLGTILSKAGGKPDNLGPFSNLLSRIAQGRYEAADPALLLEAITTALSARARPQLVVLKNCHHMSSRAAAFLQLLFARLDSEGRRHRVKFILEYREKPPSRNLAWNRSVAEIARDLKGQFQRISVLPLTLSQIADRVCVHIEAPSPQSTAEVLIRQAGGNPLFIEHLMRDLLSSKIVVRDNSGGKFYRIDHFDLFRRRVETLPTELNALLMHRIEAVMAEAPADLQALIPAYLGLASVATSGAGTQTALIDESRIAAAIGCPLEILARVRRRLVGEGIMKGSLVNPPAEFLHDLIAAASLAAVSESVHFRDAAAAFCRQLHSLSVNDAVMGGRLGQLLGQFTESVSYYEAGLRLAEERANFLEQRRCLEGLRDVFELAGGIDPIAVSRLLGVWLKLIWNELQQGSQYVTSQFIEQTRARLALLASDEVSEAGIVRSVETEVARYQLILDTRRADVESFARDAKAYIQLAINPSDLHYAATRLILMSGHLCLPRCAYEAVELALCGLEMNEHPTELSSLYSDLGSLFLIACPDKTETLWQAGLKIMQSGHRRTRDDERQLFHSLTNTALIAAILRPSESQLQGAASLTKELASRGILNPFLKLQNCLGALRFHCGDREGAVHDWHRGLQIARSSSMRMYEWPYYHNLAIAALVQDNNEEAMRWLQRAAATIRPLMCHICNSTAIQPLIGALQAKHSMLSDREQDRLSLLLFPPETYKSISVTGSVIRFVHACMTVEQHLGRDMKCAEFMPHVMTLPNLPSTAPLLSVECHDECFFLAVE